MSDHTVENDAPYPLEGWVSMKADDHQPDPKRGGCTCGFAVWYGGHVAVMAYREAVEAALAARVIPPARTDGEPSRDARIRPRHLRPHAEFGDDPSGWCGCAGCDPRDDCDCQSCRSEGER